MFQNSLFQAGQIVYSLGSGIKLPEDLHAALPPLRQFVEYVDKGIFAASADLTKNIETSLTYIGSAYFELGRMQLGIDSELPKAAVNFFLQAARGKLSAILAHLEFLHLSRCVSGSRMNTATD